MRISRVVVAATAVAALAVAGCSSGGSGSSGSAASGSGSAAASGSGSAAASGSGSAAASGSGSAAASGSGSAAASGSGSAAASGSGSAAASGSGSAAASGSGAAADCTLDDPVKVGVVFTLTGAAAQYGATQKNGVELAAEQLKAKGGVTYNVDIEDSQTDPKQAISIFEKMIADGDSIIIGPTLSNAAKQTDPVAQKAGIPVLGVSNTASGITSIGDYIWRDSLTEAAVIPQTIKKAKAKYGLKNVVVMYGNDDAFTESGYQVFKQALSDEGITVADTLTFSKTDTDFRSLLTQAKSAHPDALVVSALIDAAVPLVTQARQLGMNIPIIGGNGFNSPALMKDAGSAADGVVVGAAWNSASDNPASKAFIKAYTDKYGSAPDQFAAQAYTGMLIVNQAVRLGCSADRDSIKANLAKVKDLATPLGSFSFTSSRDASHDAVVQIVKDGTFDVLS